jgi:isoleucyl-tRNA synthetase
MEDKNQFVSMEEEVLKFWQTNQIFEKSVKKEAPKGEYVFYDGPPFATGTPHYGHLVGNIMKDVVPRFWTMNGYQVNRKWGWDCHGLPIENIVEKEMGFSSKKEIEEKAGVAKFNELCRSKVLSYTEDWKKTIIRLGRWVDMENAYRTMDLNYMESVWWVFKELWNKELIYKNYRSMYICPRCETTLSQSEVAEGYRDIKDLSVTAKFELVDEPGTFVLAWTTTPWTLPGNVALAIGEDINYAKIKVGEEIFILAKERIHDVLKDKEFEVLEEFKGRKLIGKKYQPVFDNYIVDEKLANRENGWKIYGADFVTTEDGTGVVHIAPAYGEDDLTLGRLNKLPFIQHVGMDGMFKKEMGEFAGFHVKPIDNVEATDVLIIKYLAGKGLLFSKEKYEHSYPHCWRCETPLINYATSSWFVNITKIKDKLLEEAKGINWSPAHIKDGRFGNWLEGARDWSISRQRFWASCIPIWESADGEERMVMGGVKELEDLSGEKITDLHKDTLDKITFKSPTSGKLMKRIPDVLDCWFESGSMPYAQFHYPFENKEKVEKNFPAEFIAEGIDQTRTWFYYLHAISGGLKSSQAFKNVIVNGIVLAEDGKKMSKKLKNYPDPSIIFEKYGADALRYYLLTSPVMQAENLNFCEKGVAECLRKIDMVLWNVYIFYEMYEENSPLLRGVPEGRGV